MPTVIDAKIEIADNPEAKRILTIYITSVTN